MAKQNEAAVRKVVAASLIGATIEWYDFFLYGVVAGIVFNKLYFPTGDPVVSTMLAYTTFAVGFVTRPLGGLIFGHFGDRIGRKSMLVMTLMIMGIATFLIGLVPTYDSIGIWAPILLLLLRVFQGIGLGGEWGGAVLMAYEYAPPGKKGFYASLPQIGLAMMGEGMVEAGGKRMPAAEAMRQAGLAPVQPYAKDSLSLLSSNAYGAALAILAAHDASRVLDRADEVAALSLEGLNGNIAPLLPATQGQRPYPAQQQVARRILSLLEGSALWQTDEQRPLQDPLSFRTVSQVHGAAREALRQLDVQLLVQINSSDDNPTVALDVSPPPGATPQETRYYVTQGKLRGAVLPSAGFDPTAWVVPLQSVGVALAQVAQSSAQRVLRMGDPAFTKLPRFLSPNDTTLAYTTIQKPVSLLATEIRTLSQPVSSDALAVAGNIEDVATNGPLAAQRVGMQAGRLRTLLGIELIHAAQAVDLRTRAEPRRMVGKGTGEVLAAFRQEVPFLSQDRRLADDIARADRFLDQERDTAR